MKPRKENDDAERRTPTYGAADAAWCTPGPATAHPAAGAADTAEEMSTLPPQGPQFQGGTAMPQYEGREVITIGKAEQCKAIIEGWLKKSGTEDLGRLYQPGHEGPFWCYSLEGGPLDWPVWVCDMAYDEWPPGVFAEPVTGWCLGLYPA